MRDQNHLLSTRTGLIALACLTINSLSPVVAGENLTADEQPFMYRYKSPAGHVTMGSQVPAESLKLGYEILNKRLKVIKTIPPALSESQKAAHQAAEEEKWKTQQEQARLLQAFSSAEDAERARDRKVNALDVIIKITRGNITQLNRDYETSASTAASHQRAGRPVPEHLEETLQSIEKQIADAKLFIDKKLEERRLIEEKYNADIEILKGIEAP